MPLKKTVAMERRIDLASLFCLIARHGPAVLVTLVVIGCSLAGFVMFRNMREKRRRRREEGADRRDSHAGYRDAGLGQGREEEPRAAAEEETSRRESTDVSDEHAYHAHVRQRRAAPERNPYKEELHDGDTAVDKASYSFFWQRCPPKATESHAEETRYNSERSDSYPSTEDVTEEVCCAKEPGLKNDVGYEEKEKVIEADSSEDITSTAEEVSEEECAQEEETVQFTFNSQLCSAPTPTLGVKDHKENAEGTSIKQEHELKNSIAPVLKPKEIPSAPHIDEEVIIEQVHNGVQQNLPVQCDKAATNTVSTTSPEVMEEDLVEASHIETRESEPFKLEDTKEDFSLASSVDVNVVAHLSSNFQQQSEPLIPPTSDTEIDKTGLCPEELSHFQTDTNKISNHENIGLVNTECPKATSDDNKKVSHLEAGSHSLDVTEDKSLNHQEITERVEIETSLLSENTSAVQNNQCQELLPQPENGFQSQMDSLSDQKDDICEEKQTLPICKENDLKIAESSNVLMHEQCLVHPPTSQSQLHEIKTEETSLSGLATDVSVTVETTSTTVQTYDPKPLEGAPELDTKTILPPALPSQISENKSNQTCQKIESVDATYISASTRDKIESMVERMVAEVYKDVKQTTLEERPMQLEVNKCSELAQDNASIAPDNLTCQEVVEGEVVSGSNISSQSTEGNVNSVSCLNDITKVEDEVHKDVISNVSENKYPNVTPNDCSNIPVTEAVPNPQDANHLAEESVEHLETDKNVEIAISEDAHLALETAVEVQSTQLEQKTPLAQLCELLVQPILNINSTVHDNFSNESIVNDVEQETCVEDDCSNMATRIQAGTSTVSCPEIADIEKVDDEKKIQSSSEREIVESVTTSCQFEQQSERNESELLIDNGKCEFGNVLQEGKGAPKKIPSGIKAEVSENTAILNDVQGEQRESEMLFDTSNNSTAKRSKVVIVCRTAEASVSTVEMSDSEDVEGETSYLQLSSRSFSCQDPIDIYRNVANEEPRADVVACTSDTLTAQTVIEEMTTEEKLLTETGKPLDLTSHVALDIPQNCGASVEATKQVEQKDTPSLESGISSMAVSPEKEESTKVIGQDMLTTCQVYAERTVSHSVYTSNGFVQVAKEESSDMDTGPESPSSPQISALEEMANELLMSNEDSFGSEIEDGYHKATEEFMTHAVDNIKITSEGATKETVKHFEKTEQACVANKENREKVDSEKTEISIMEATMDHNEWITEGNYQVLPWMTAASFSKDLISSKEAKDIENEPQASSSEESAESSKKVLAVQPMPQNVNVTFRVHYVTLSSHQTVAVTGDQPELGAWKSVVSLEKTKDGYWSCVVGLPAESHVEWKFVVLEKGEVCRWEECGNRLLYTGYGDDLLVHKWWGIL